MPGGCAYRCTERVGSEREDLGSLLWNSCLLEAMELTGISTWQCVCTWYSSVQSLNRVQLFVTPMDMPGFSVHHQLLELAQTHVHRVGDAIQPSHPVVPFSSCLQSSPASESFPVSQFFTSGGQSIGVSASASVLPMNIQD